MDHDSATELLADLAAGTLRGADAEAVAGHVGGCTICADALATMKILRAAGPAGSILLEAHPPADAIVQFAARDGSLAPGALTEVAAHVRGCPECGLEVRLAEQSLTPRTSWAQRLIGVFRRPDRSLAWARLGVVVLILLMSYPAYLGLRGPGRGATGSGAVLDRGAGTRLLYLPAARRGSHDPVVLPRGDGLQPVAMEFDLALLQGADPRLRFALRNADREVWSLATRAAAVTNPELSTLSVLIPHHALTPGAYRLDLFRDGEARALATYTFRVEP